ncbi:MAG: aminotransferase class IV [Microthrixaceae bacterium]
MSTPPPCPSVFETIEVLDGHPFALAEHLSLLSSAAATLGLPDPDRKLIDSAVGETLRRWGPEPGRLRVSWSGRRDSSEGTLRGSLHLFIAPLIVPNRPAHVDVADTPVDTGSVLYGLKSSGMTPGVATIASHPDADEVLLVNLGAHLVEGCSSNIFLVCDDSLITPPLSSGCRAGVTRSIILEAVSSVGISVREEAVEVSDLAEVAEAFLASTGRNVQSIASIAGRPLTVDGELTQATRIAFLAARARDLSRDVGAPHHQL